MRLWKKRTNACAGHGYALNVVSADLTANFADAAIRLNINLNEKQNNTCSRFIFFI